MRNILILYGFLVKTQGLTLPSENIIHGAGKIFCKTDETFNIRLVDSFLPTGDCLFRYVCLFAKRVLCRVKMIQQKAKSFMKGRTRLINALVQNIRFSKQIICRTVKIICQKYDGSKFAGTFKDGQILEGRYTDANGNVYLCHYTYKLNGRRKSGEVKLIELANDGKTEEKKPSESASKKERLEKSGLLNRDLTMMTAIRKSVRGAEFKELYSGKAGKDEKSEKRLMAILNFFTNSNAEQMHRIFRSSKLYAEEKGQNYISELASGAIKNGQEFAKAIKTQMKNRQKGISAEKGATR